MNWDFLEPEIALKKQNKLLLMTEENCRKNLNELFKKIIRR